MQRILDSIDFLLRAKASALEYLKLNDILICPHLSRYRAKLNWFENYRTRHGTASLLLDFVGMNKAAISVIRCLSLFRYSKEESREVTRVRVLALNCHRAVTELQRLTAKYDLNSL